MVMKNICIGSIYKTFFYFKSDVLIELDTKIHSMQPFGYGLKIPKTTSFSALCVGVFFLLQVGVESVADCGSEADAIVSDKLEEDGDVFVVIDKLSDREGGSLICVGGGELSAAKEVLQIGVRGRAPWAFPVV